jgi:hypothetical protein
MGRKTHANRADLDIVYGVVGKSIGPIGRFSGSIAEFVGKRAMENAASRKSPKAGLSDGAWKSRNRSDISTFPTAPATTG